jgi:hypothetical protein
VDPARGRSALVAYWRGTVAVGRYAVGGLARSETLIGLLGLVMLPALVLAFLLYLRLALLWVLVCTVLGVGWAARRR